MIQKFVSTLRACIVLPLLVTVMSELASFVTPHLSPVTVAILNTASLNKSARAEQLVVAVLKELSIKYIDEGGETAEVSLTTALISQCCEQSNIS